ncbi:MAG: M15 family metallopeptidase [Clostridia bacterium]|nr:M15 family metallopeptidase [Clostridia bacterium]
MDNNYTPRPTTARQRRLAARAAKQRKIILAIAVCFVLILLMFFILIVGNIVSLFADDTSDSPDGEQNDIQGNLPSEGEDPSNGEDELPADDPNTTYVPVAPDAVRRGNLILVNTTHEYIFPTINQNLINVYDSQALSGTLSNYFQLPSSSLLMDKTAYNALDKMMQAFYAQTAIPNVIVSTAYRTYAEQEGKSVPPGYSDSHTGLSFALNVITNDGKTTGLSSDPIYDWIFDNCYKYGFTVRYPDGKEALTQVSDYNYYFRYVGYVHAYIMKINDMCLEEYIPYIQGYSKSTPLAVTTDDGISHEIYYVPAAIDGSDTSLPVPSDHPYTVSGDNEAGFIVTVTMS